MVVSRVQLSLSSKPWARAGYSAPRTLNSWLTKTWCGQFTPAFVDLILAVAQLHDTVDDAGRVGGQRGFRRLVRHLPLTIVPDLSL
jgi:hypothetical protein